MRKASNTLEFPNGIPDGYIPLKNEPDFDADTHLDLGLPQTITSLDQLGYQASEIVSCPSPFGVSSAFKILSDEGFSGHARRVLTHV